MALHRGLFCVLHCPSGTAGKAGGRALALRPLLLRRTLSLANAIRPRPTAKELYAMAMRRPVCAAAADTDVRLSGVEGSGGGGVRTRSATQPAGAPQPVL